MLVRIPLKNETIGENMCQIRNHLMIKLSVMSLLSGQFSPKYSQQAPHSSPVRARFGVSFVSSMSGLCSAAGIAVLYVISRYSGPRYNGTRRYITTWLTEMKRNTWRKVSDLLPCLDTQAYDYILNAFRGCRLIVILFFIYSQLSYKNENKHVFLVEAELPQWQTG